MNRAHTGADRTGAQAFIVGLGRKIRRKPRIAAPPRPPATCWRARKSPSDESWPADGPEAASPGGHGPPGTGPYARGKNAIHSPRSAGRRHRPGGRPGSRDRRAVNLTQQLVNAPADDVYPETFAARSDMAKQTA
jgi:hypothetical protein